MAGESLLGRHKALGSTPSTTYKPGLVVHNYLGRGSGVEASQGGLRPCLKKHKTRDWDYGSAGSFPSPSKHSLNKVHELLQSSGNAQHLKGTILCSGDSPVKLAVNSEQRKKSN